jgi:hypothetical protein
VSTLAGSNESGNLDGPSSIAKLNFPQKIFLTSVNQIVKSVKMVS